MASEKERCCSNSKRNQKPVDVEGHHGHARQRRWRDEWWRHFLCQDNFHGKGLNG